MTSPNVVDATDTTFAQEVVERSRAIPVVVDFWAPWCGPCRVLGPMIERVAGEHEGRVALVKVNTDDNPTVAQRYGIRSIPAVIAFRDGAPVASFVGAQPEPQVRAFFKKVLPTAADGLAEEGARALTAGNLATAADRFEAALAVDVGHRGATLGLAAVRLEQRDLDAAGELAARLPGDANAKRVLAHVTLRRVADGADRAALEGRLAENDGDAEAHYRLGALLAIEGDWEPAIDHLLSTVALDRKLDGDGGRLRTLDALELLGADHPLLPETRRRLANLLF
ncbi:MAG: thioredoxin [Chloroflexi bacterium]|nr:thioredoxin [Chloroflexota bacterium]